MTDRSSVIFGNKMPDKVYKKAVKSKKKYMKKFGDDSKKNYEVAVEKNRYIGDSLGVYNILVGNLAENAHYDVNAHAEKGTFDTEKGIIVGNIRMGFGHYRISMAMASAAKAMGYTPYWMDLNSYGETTCTKVIGAQNDLYSLGSRLSKNPIFNKLVWEPMNYEGFRALSYNAADQKNAELMAPVYRNVPKDIPVIGIEPALKPAVLAKEHSKVVVMATPMTLSQTKFNSMLHVYEDEANIIKMPCPGLVEYIEGGMLEGPVLDEYLEKQFEPYEKSEIDAVVLGCTHYPLVKDEIQKHLPGVAIYDGGFGTAKQTRKRLTECGLLSGKESGGEVKIFNSKNTEDVLELSRRLLNL